MDKLIIKYFSDEITDEEKTVLFSRMEKEDQLKLDFASYQNIRAITTLLPATNDTCEGIDKLLDFKKRHQSKRKPSKFHLRHAAQYAAVIFFTVLLTWGTTRLFNQQEKPSRTAYVELAVPPGQRAHLKLEDGSTVWLNARSFLRYPSAFGKEIRRVELSGEAYFEIKKESGRPFIVSTEKADIKVTGTVFSVFAYKDQKEFNTSLVEGSVLIYNKSDLSDVISLSANERAVLSGKKFKKQTFSGTDFLLWKEGIYTFDDIPFNEIIKKLELYYDIPIYIKNKQIYKYRFSGKFRQRDGVISVLRTLQKVKYFSFIKNDELNYITIK